MFSRILLFVVSFAIIQPSTSYAERIVLEQRAIQTLFIPVGFDNNDNSQVVADGFLPNPCYKIGPHTVKVDRAAKVVLLQQQVYKNIGRVCPQVLVPYTTVFNLGVLEDGNYTIKDLTNNKTLGKVSVKKALNQGPDDYFYAPVADARVDIPNMTVIVEGVYTDDCLDLEQMKIFMSPENVVIVQPILKAWSGGRSCKKGKFPFKYTRPLPQLEGGVYLLHVRGMSGLSINKTFEFYY
ncbi:MAG: hypothetical protein AB7F59_09950 [Bdellovibrionales bacterium]